MKKTISYLTAMCLALGTLAISASADATVISAGSAQATAGESVSIPISISGCDGFSNISLEVGYDSEVFELKSAKQNRDVDADYVASQYTTVNPYVLTWNSIVNTVFDGTLVTMNFKIKDDAKSGTYPITVSYYKGEKGTYTDGNDVNFDEDFEPIVIEYVNGSITVEGSEPTAITTLAGVFDENTDEAPAVAFYTDVTAGDNTVTGLIWNVTMGSASTGDIEAHNVNIAAGTSVTYGLVVSVEADGVDAESITAENVKVTIKE